MFGLRLLLFWAWCWLQVLDIALVGGRWCNLGRDILHCYSARCYPLCRRYWAITITDITHHPQHSFTPHLLWDQSDQGLSWYSLHCVPHTYVDRQQLLDFFSHHSLPAYRDCSMGIDCLSEDWTSCRYSSYSSLTQYADIGNRNKKSIKASLLLWQGVIVS